MVSFTLRAAAVVAATALAVASSPCDALRTIVVHDETVSKSTHSKFFGALESRGHELSFKLLGPSTKVELIKHGEPLYENLVWMSPQVQLTRGNPTLDNVLAFIDAGHNAFVGLDSELSDTLREFSAECGVKVDPKHSRVVDYFSNVDSDSTMVRTDKATPNTRVLGSKFGGKSVVFNGIGLEVAASDLVTVSALTGASTSAVSYSDVKSKKGLPAPRFGTQIALVTALQFRNNARVVLSGSTSLCSDEFAGLESGNAEFCQQVSRWAFGERGLLRYSNVRHRLANGGHPETQLKHKIKANLARSMFPEPEIAPNSLVYRIKDDIVFSLFIEELTDNGWKPFKDDDVQLEFRMLDPYLRQFVKHDGKGNYSLEFKIPDVYGVFKFRILHRREGLSVLDVERQVSVRPFRHNEYERFILAASPYYTGAFTMMAAFFVFSVVFLGTKD